MTNPRGTTPARLPAPIPGTAANDNNRPHPPTPGVAADAATDEELATRGHQAGAFAELVRRHYGAINRLCFRISLNHDDADEITQEVFVQAYRAVETFRRDSRFTTWLHRIAINAALMRRRSDRRHPSQSLDQLQAAFGGERSMPADLEQQPAESIESAVDRKRLTQRAWTALGNLDEATRAVFILRYVQELPGSQVADIMRMSERATRQRAYRARVALRSALQRAGAQS